MPCFSQSSGDFSGAGGATGAGAGVAAGFFWATSSFDLSSLTDFSSALLASSFTWVFLKDLSVASLDFCDNSMVVAHFLDLDSLAAASAVLASALAEISA